MGSREFALLYHKITKGSSTLDNVIHDGAMTCWYFCIIGPLSLEYYHNKEPPMHCFDIFFVVSFNKLLNKQWRCRPPWRFKWRYLNELEAYFFYRFGDKYLEFEFKIQIPLFVATQNTASEDSFDSTFHKILHTVWSALLWLNSSQFTISSRALFILITAQIRNQIHHKMWGEITYG